MVWYNKNGLVWFIILFNVYLIWHYIDVAWISVLSVVWYGSLYMCLG
jgi:hypothetical protein